MTLPQEFVKDLALWISEPGLIREIKISFYQGFVVELIEADSQPEFYQSTLVRSRSTHKDLFESFKIAKHRLEQSGGAKTR